MKRNVTVTLSQETARWLRVEAARRDTSVSQYLSELVDRERAHEQGYAEAMQRHLSRPLRPIRSASQPLPSRADLHER